MIDAHTHIDIDGVNKIASIENIVKEMEINDVTSAVVFPLSCTVGCNELMMKKINGDKRFIPIAFIDPNWDNAIDILINCIEKMGMKGLKLHPILNNFHIDDLNKLGEIYDYCNKMKLHVIIHCTSDNRLVHPYRIEGIAQKYKNATFQIAHMGAVWDANPSIQVAKRNNNIFVDTGIASFNAIRRAINEIPNKIVIGCDFPFYTYKTEIEKVKESFRYSIYNNNNEILNMILGNTIKKNFEGGK